MNIVERVAAAIYEKRHLDKPSAILLFGGPAPKWELLCQLINRGSVVPMLRDEALEEARAAICAMREPTKKMLNSNDPIAVIHLAKFILI